MHVTKILIVIFFILFMQYCHGQELEISGFISSSDGNIPLENASISILKENKILAYTYSNSKGYYFLKINYENSSAKYIISANSLGYQEEKKAFNLLEDKNYNFNFLLNEKTEQLNEVVLESWEKIKVKRDTITFKASAFEDGSEDVVEDLLKNIPGIEVGSNGDIKVNGKGISKLLIEGDDLFDDKYKLLSKNLDAKNIDEIEILKNYEDNPVLKSFQNSDKVAVNLKLKQEKKNVWFGNIDIGYGVKNRYNSSLNIGLLKKNIKLINLSNANNLGQKAISQTQNESPLTSNDLETGGKIEKKNFEIVDIDNISSSNFSNNEDIFNNSFLNSLSFLTNLSSNTKLRSLTYFTYDEIQKQNNRIIEYFIQPDRIFFTEQNNIDIKDLSISNEFELKHYSQNESYFTYNFTFENNTTKTNGNLIFNDDNISQFQDTQKYNFYNHLNYTKKLSENLLFITYGYLGENRTDQEYTIDPNIFSDLFSNEESLSIHQESKTPLKYYGFISELTSKLKKSEYQFEFAALVNEDKIENIFRFSDQIPIDTLSNRTEYKNSSLSFTGKFKHNISEHFRVNSSLNISKNFLKIHNTEEDYFFLNPTIRFNIRKTKFGNIAATYSYLNNIPKSRYLTKNYILKNYRTFTRGTDQIEKTNNHSFSLFYSYSFFKKQFLINSYFLHSFSNKSYGLNSLITEQTNFSHYQMVGGGRLTTYNLSLSKYLKFISSSIKFQTLQDWSNNSIIVNNRISELYNYTGNYRIQGTTYFKIPLNFKFGFQYNRTKGNFEDQIASNKYLEGDLSTTYRLDKKWLFKFENKFYSINDNHYNFINLNAYYTPEESRISYTLSANNLTNIKEFQDIYISDFQRKETNFRIIPRYIILNIKYRF